MVAGRSRLMMWGQDRIFTSACVTIIADCDGHGKGRLLKNQVPDVLIHLSPIPDREKMMHASCQSVDGY
jgi:hypothetical protein